MTYGNGNTVAYDYDDLERVKNIYYNNSSSPAYTYTYKGEGTLGQLTDNTNNRTYAYTYDSLGRLNGLTEQFGSNSVQTFSASYDTANRPTSVTYAVSPSWNGTLGSDRVYTYTWQGGKLIAEYDGTNTLEFFYDESGAPYALSCNGTTYYYVTNLQGDVVKIVNASGTSQAEYSYNAWGQVISATGTLAAVNPIRYRGYYYDSETGFYYLKSRYYDPEVCRFINADGIISTVQGFLGCNMFAYCLNNPVNMSDAGGCDARPETDFLYTTYFVFATTAATVLTIPGLDTAVTEAARWLEKELRKVSEKIKNLKTQRPPEEHHIVARTAWLAKPARNIINEVLDGGINDPQNLVSVNYLFHRRMHTASYYLIVDALIEGAYLVADGDKEKQKLYVSEMLAFIKTTIQSCGGA